MDHDDSSEYFEERRNFLVYGQHGLKSYFGGHDNVAHHNVYAYTIGPCVFIGFGHARPSNAASRQPPAPVPRLRCDGAPCSSNQARDFPRRPR